ncbi:MAG: nucleotidyltransferase family protein [Reyranella sp.]
MNAGVEVIPEFRFLCIAARPQPDLTRLSELLRKGLDHRVLIRLADGHGVRPSLLDCLGQLSWEAVPDDAKADLERFRQNHLLKSLALAGELHRLAASLSDRSIPFVAFKGPTLALALYGGIAAREYNDIDVIVPRRRIDAAEDVLEAMGYASPQGDRRFRRAFLAAQRQYAFVRTDEGAAIDLHWGFGGAHVPFPLAPDEIWDDTSLLSVGGRDVPVLSAPNLALLLAGHGTKENWAMLKWVSDFARMIDRHPVLDWQALHARARTRGCGDAVLLACAMAGELLDVAVPKALAPRIADSGRVRKRAAAMAGAMRRGLPPAGPAEHFADLLLCDRPIDWIRGALKLAFTPTAGDYEAMRLPPALWSAYYATRPCRLAFRTAVRRA